MTNVLKVQAYFTLHKEDFIDLEEISKVLGIVPTQQYLIGDRVNHKVVRKNSAWQYGTEYEESDDIRDQLNKVYFALKDKVAELQRLKMLYQLDYRFTIVIFMNGHTPPVIFFHRDILHFIDQIEADIEIDAYT
jgi:hypothetical protein